MTPNKHAALREELSNPAIGSNHHLRKLALLLLDELEYVQKSNEFLKGQLSELANFNPDWDKLEASYESWREIAGALEAAEKRIAELEASTITVTLPMPYDINVAGERIDWDKGDHFDRDEVIEALRAAGIKIKGE